MDMDMDMMLSHLVGDAIEVDPRAILELILLAAQPEARVEWHVVARLLLIWDWHIEHRHALSVEVLHEYD